MHHSKFNILIRIKLFERFKSTSFTRILWYANEFTTPLTITGTRRKQRLLRVFMPFWTNRDTKCVFTADIIANWMYNCDTFYFVLTSVDLGLWVLPFFYRNLLRFNPSVCWTFPFLSSLFPPPPPKLIDLIANFHCIRCEHFNFRRIIWEF